VQRFQYVPDRREVDYWVPVGSLSMTAGWRAVTMSSLPKTQEITTTLRRSQLKASDVKQKPFVSL